jgi:hypothetical protein
MAIETTYVQRDANGFARVTQAAAGSIKSTNVGVAATPTLTALPATSLTNRRRLYIKNVDTNTFYIGDNSVSTSNGYPVRQYEEVVIDIAGVTVYAIAATAAVAKVLEIA